MEETIGNQVSYNGESVLLNWSVIVFPDATSGKVPAVSTWGLVALALLIICGASVIMLKSPRAETE